MKQIIDRLNWLGTKLLDGIQAVPVRIKIGGIVMLPVLILGFTLNYWITTGLSDWLSYILTDQRVQAAMQAGSRSVILVTVLSALTSILFGLLLTVFLTKPLIDLNRTAQAVRGGKLGSRARVWAKDEIGEVAHSVNSMIDQLVSNQMAITKANLRLEAMNEIAMAAGRELDLKEVLRSILSGILAVMNLKQGWVYLVDGDSYHFELTQHEQLPDSILEVLNQPGSEEFCGCQNDLISGKNDLATARRYPCSRLNPNHQPDAPYAHISIPLRARGQLLGVINLLCSDTYVMADGDIELINAIGAQASEIVANAWLHARLLEKEAARKALLESLVRTQESERKHLARELHDGAGQTLTTLLVRLKGLEKQAPDEAFRAGLVAMQNLVADSIEQVRELAYTLRPATLEEFGLAHALVNLANEMAGKAGLEVKTRCNLDCELPNDIETALFRIAQESLTNVIRHAEAKSVEIELIQTPISVGLRIEDDGCGFDPDEIIHRGSAPHLGLISLQERAEMFGGSLSVYSAPGAGTSVQVRIPLVETLEMP